MTSCRPGKLDGSMDFLSLLTIEMDTGGDNYYGDFSPVFWPQWSPGQIGWIHISSCRTTVQKYRGVPTVELGEA